MRLLPKNVVQRRETLYFRRKISGRQHYLRLPPLADPTFAASYEAAATEMSRRAPATKFLPAFAHKAVKRWNRKAAASVKMEPLPAWAVLLAREARKRAKRKGLEFAITPRELGDLVRRADEHCEISGIAFDHERLGAGEWRPFAPSLDRISSAGGYTYKNLRIVCVCVNAALNRWGDEVFWTMVQAASERLGGKSPTNARAKVS